MAWSESSIPLNLGFAYEADRPMFLGKNFARHRNVRAEWRDSGSWASGANQTDPAYPSVRIHDGQALLSTRRDFLTAPPGTIYLLLDLADVVSDAPNQINAVMLQHANLHRLAGTIGVTIELSESSNFPVGSQTRTLAEWSPISSYDARRLVELDIGGAGGGFERVRYVRIAIESSEEFEGAADGLPLLTELWLCDRIQMGRMVGYSFESFGCGWEGEADRLSGGLPMLDVRNRGGAAFDRQWIPLERAERFGIDDAANLRRLCRETDYGARAFVYIEEPATKPQRAHVMRSVNMRMSVARIGVERSIIPLGMREEAPYVDSEMLDDPMPVEIAFAFEWLGKDAFARSWPAAQGGITLGNGDYADLNVSTSGLDPLGLGATRVDHAVIMPAGTGADFRATGAAISGWHNAPGYHVRLIWNRSTDSGVVLAFFAGANETVGDRFIVINAPTGIIIGYDHVGAANIELGAPPTGWLLFDVNVHVTGAIEVLCNGARTLFSGLQAITGSAMLSKVNLCGSDVYSDVGDAIESFGLRLGGHVTEAEHDAYASALGLI